jgi:hypothetical protein
MPLLPSCGIPTAMPMLPKEVAVKMEPSVSMPLGKVNYSLFSGLTGGSMKGGWGRMDDMLGESWVEDLQEKGATLYDYRPPNGDDTIQTFLVHYNLDMEDILGWDDGGFDLTEFQEKMDKMTGETKPIKDVEPYIIPSMNIKKQIEVTIPLNTVTTRISENTDSLSPITAFLPVLDGTKKYDFPYDIKNLPPELTESMPQENPDNFFITLKNMESLTFKEGTIEFKFTLTYHNYLFPPSTLVAGSTLKLSDFNLKTVGSSGAASTLIENVTAENKVVELNQNGATGDISISFDNAELPHEFDLVCKLETTGTAPDLGYFELKIEPKFNDLNISGVSGLVLTTDQVAELNDNLPETDSPIEGDLGPDFKATVEVGKLEIDTGELFPPITDPPTSGVEGWNLTLDLSKLIIKQDNSANGVEGLSLGESQKPLYPGDNDLQGEILNSSDVKIRGEVGVSIPDNKLTFYFPDGINNQAWKEYKKQIEVKTDISLLSEVNVKDDKFGLGAVDQEIEQELGDDFASFKEWINYIQFFEPTDDPDSGLGVMLDIATLKTVGGLGLFITANDFGLDNVFQPLVNLKDPATGNPTEKARLFFKNRDSGGYTLDVKTLPEKVPITVKLGLADPPRAIGSDRILTLKNVVPGETIEVIGGEASLVFGWDIMSIVPDDHKNGENDPDDPLPDYPMAGTFPDKDEGEEGIDLNDMIPKGLGFYIPKEGEAKDNREIDARLYVGLKRQKLVDTNGDGAGDAWEDVPGSWNGNMRINRPSLDFSIKYVDETLSGNLFSYGYEEKDADAWTLSRPIGDILAEQKEAEDSSAEEDPSRIYAIASLPEPEKGLPLENLAKALNAALIGDDGKKGPLSFEYKVRLTPLKKEGTDEEILLYRNMIDKKIVVSVDLVALVPMIFRADPNAPGPVAISFGPDLEGDLFGRQGGDDNSYFDRITSFGFDMAVKNGSVLSAGKVFLENITTVEEQKYSLPLLDFTGPRSRVTLGGEDIEKIKAIWPFVPRLSVELEPDTPVQIKQDFKVELQSVTLRAGSEFEFETGL